jgi:hypothetical protein
LSIGIQEPAGLAHLGRALINAQPKADAGELDEGEIIGGELGAMGFGEGGMIISAFHLCLWRSRWRAPSPECDQRLALFSAFFAG